ncbi:hypothetical protein L1049_028143 [Liquidambar formosana]|uniref:C3H1-type domain-containing protein n=1 Tax=Liquidambar formosana TaxID=63359 RepID=A0AAP0RIB2_LIQFO
MGGTESSSTLNPPEQPGLGFQSSPSSSASHDPLPPSSDLDPPSEQTLAEEFQKLDLKETEENEKLDLKETEENENEKDEQSGENGSESERGSESASEDEKEKENESEKLGDESESASKDEKSKRYHYPVRPDAEDCSYYLRTGTCKFGSNCKFNHPVRRKNQGVKEKVKEREEFLERPGQMECKYYLRTGGCKFGKACRYNHTRGKTPVAPVLEYNFLGLPIRLGERECPYYMRTGSCKYATNCRFNHPDPTAGCDPPSGYGNGGSVSLQGASQPTVASWSPSRTLNETGPFVPMMYSPTQGVPPPNSEWNGYQASVYPPERSMHPPPAFVVNNPATETSVYTHHQQQMLVEEFPERPGQPECSYFLKTGDCKFRSGCKYNHPKSRIPKSPPCTVTEMGLPLRPDQIICAHYSRYGICKFGPNCKFDHPQNIGHSASAVSGLDHPPPFGNTATTAGTRLAGNGNGSEAVIQQPL